jgi:arabinoxylan arabinofuranohydrolase
MDIPQRSDGLAKAAVRIHDFIKSMRTLLTLSAALCLAALAQAQQATDPGKANPILPGYYADPSVVQDGGKSYIYATLDPWGDDTLGCWESTDFKNWTYKVLNWPTKSSCHTKDSGGAGVWAPSVVKGRDGKFYMYVSVGNQVWAGVAESPTGPWKNPLGDKPLIPKEYKPGYHMIDAEAFIDTDGQAYLYWGSGHNWVNGKCWVVKLKPDMVTFDGEVKDVTPANYFEGPFMVKRGDTYFLTYSQGKTTEDTYRVHYATGKTPFGPFTEASNSPILVTDKDKQIISPGHHAIFSRGGKDYIIYHRHSIPFDPKFIGRQTCVDELHFTSDGLIEKVVPTHESVALVQGRLEGKAKLSAKATLTASSSIDDLHGPDAVKDDNYTTRWTAKKDDGAAWIQMDLGKVSTIKRQTLRLEYAWKPYFFKVESSDDSKSWKTVESYESTPAQGSPITIQKAAKARYLRLSFTGGKGTTPSLWEWAVE